MKQFFLLTVISFSVVLLSGCGSSSDNGTEIDYSTAEVEGNWTSAQLSTELSTIQALIDNDTWRYVTSTSDFVYEMRYGYRITGTKTVQPNNLTVKKLDLVYLGYFRTCTTQSGVDAFNSLEACSFTDWEVNITKDTTVCDSGDLSVGTVMKNIYYVENNATLYTGDFSDVDIDFYPEALDTNVTYEK